MDVIIQFDRVAHLQKLDAFNGNKHIAAILAGCTDPQSHGWIHGQVRRCVAHGGTATECHKPYIDHRYLSMREIESQEHGLIRPGRQQKVERNRRITKRVGCLSRTHNAHTEHHRRCIVVHDTQLHAVTIAGMEHVFSHGYGVSIVHMPCGAIQECFRGIVWIHACILAPRSAPTIRGGCPGKVDHQT